MTTVKTFGKIQARVLGEGEKKIIDIQTYGMIDDLWGDVNASALRAFLTEHQDAWKIKNHINTIGGVVPDGVAIYNMLENHPAKVESYVEGAAYSMGSIVALAGKTIMHRGTQLFLHNPWGMTMGDSKEMRDYADALDASRDGLISIYQAKTGLGEEELKALMDNETFLNPEQAKQHGFADKIDDKAVDAEPVPATTEAAARVRIGAVAFAAASVPEAMKKAFGISPEPEPESEPEPEAEPEDKEPDEEIDEDPPQDEDEKPDAVAAYKRGIKAERERIKAIEELEALGHEKIIYAAKYDEPLTPEKTALAVMRAEAEARKAYGATRAKELEGNNTRPAPPVKTSPSGELEDAINKGRTIAEIQNRRRK